MEWIGFAIQASREIQVGTILPSGLLQEAHGWGLIEKDSTEYQVDHKLASGSRCMRDG